jgi:hypothetical protein
MGNDHKEEDVDPELNFMINWNEAKDYFKVEVLKIAKKIIELK